MKFIIITVVFLSNLIIAEDLKPNQEVKKDHHQDNFNAGSIHNSNKNTNQQVFGGHSKDPQTLAPVITHKVQQKPAVQTTSKTIQITNNSLNHIPEQMKEVVTSAGFWEILGAVTILFGMYFLAAKLGWIDNSRFTRKYQTMENEHPEIYECDDENEVLRRQYL